MMIVIGERKAQIQESCLKYQSETVNTPITSKLLRIYLKKTYNKIGITAGASTPGSIIEEVVKAMSENLKMRRTLQNCLHSMKVKLLITGTL